MRKKLQLQIQDSVVWVGAFAGSVVMILANANLHNAAGRWLAAGAAITTFTAAVKNFPSLDNPPEPADVVIAQHPVIVTTHEPVAPLAT